MEKHASRKEPLADLRASPDNEMPREPGKFRGVGDSIFNRRWYWHTGDLEIWEYRTEGDRTDSLAPGQGGRAPG